MKIRLWLTSLFTLGILFSFVFMVLLLAAYDGGLISAGLMLALTVFFNFLMWLISPWLMDRMQNWFYKSRIVSLDEIRSNKPNLASFIENVCKKHGIRVPTLRILDDMNPTAFCYGSTANRSRLVVSRGLFHYLDEGEAAAVYGHELGHIVNRDFVVMTIAATLVQILYEIYYITIRIKTRRGNPLLPLAIASLVFYWLGTYLLLFLSRTREYLADRFSAEETGDPNLLSTALVKIAYGIAQQPDTVQTKRLIQSTRSLGIYDPKAAGSIGYAYQAVDAQKGQAAAVPAPAGFAPTAAGSVTLAGIRRIEKVFLFDLYNPWARIAELGSTHPLTGKRIRALQEFGKTLSKQPIFSFERIDAHGRELDMGKMYGKFFFEVLLWFSPHILGIAALVGGFFFPPSFFGILLGIGLGMTMRALYRYPGLGRAEKTNVLELMSDPYASPLRGRAVELEGRIIGRADAGGRFGEDMEMEDKGGGLIMVNYESPMPIFGNLWFGARTTGKLVGQDVTVLGWFRRSVYHIVDLKRMVTAGGQKVSSYTRFWGVIGAFIVLGLGVGLAAVGFQEAMTWQPAVGGYYDTGYGQQPGYGYPQQVPMQPGYPTYYPQQPSGPLPQ